MTKDDMILHFEWIDLFDEAELTKEEQAEILFAAMDYVRNGTEQAFSERLMKSVWATVRKRIDYDLGKYNKQCEANKENGKKGGRPKKEALEEADEKPKNRMGFSENPKNPLGKMGFSEKPKKPDTDYDTDIDIDIDTDSDLNNNIYNNNIHSVDNIQGQSGQNVPSQDQVRNYFLKHKQTTHEADNFYNFYSAKGWMLNGDPIKFWARLADKWIANIRAPAKKGDFMNFHQRSYDYDKIEKMLLSK